MHVSSPTTFQASPPLDAEGLGKRLSSRLQEKGWGYKEFQRRVREATDGARGTSYGSVWAYVNGEVAEPRHRIVAAMADVLGLSRTWLFSGRGPRTREEAVREDVVPLAGRTEPDEARMREILESMELARTRLPGPEAALLSRRDHVLENLVVDLLESGGRSLASWGRGEVAEAVTLVAWLLALPLRMLDPDARGRRLADRDSYVLGMAATIRATLPPSPDGQPFNVLGRLRTLRTALQRAHHSAPGADAPGAGSHAAH